MSMHFVLVSGQAGAISLGIARALQTFDPDDRIYLKKGECSQSHLANPAPGQQCKLIQSAVDAAAEGLLTRDPREVERKKPGQPKARKKDQWVKR